MAALDRPFDEVIATYERASQTVPARAEALHAASHYCRDKGKNAEGMEFARRGLDLKQPERAFRSALGLRLWHSRRVRHQCLLGRRLSRIARRVVEAAGERQTAAVDGEAHRRQRALRRRQDAGESSRPTSARSALRTWSSSTRSCRSGSLHSRVKDSPRVMVAILAKQKEPALPLYLDCIEALDYPKSSIVLYIRTNNNTDKTEADPARLGGAGRPSLSFGRVRRERRRRTGRAVSRARMERDAL